MYPPPPPLGNISGRPSPSGSTLNSGISRLDHTRSRSHSRPTTPMAANGFTDLDESTPSFPASLSSSEYNPFSASSDDRSAPVTDFALLPHVQPPMQISSLHQQSTPLTRSLSTSNSSSISRFGSTGAGVNTLSPDPFDPSSGTGGRPLRSLSMMTHQSSYPNLPSTNTHGSSSTQDGRASSSSSSAFA